MFNQDIICDYKIEPSSYEEVLDVVTKANREKLKVHVLGFGNHHVGDKVKANVCLSLRKLTRILDVSVSDLYVTAQAGVDITTLQKYLADRGLFLPFTYDGSLGGLASTNWPSYFSLLYPYPKDYLLGAKIVTGKGEIIKSGSKTTKFSSGYKIWKVLSGTLGKLGVYLELTFRLIPKPEKIVFAEVKNPMDYLVIRPWGLLSVKDQKGEKNYIIIGGFERFIERLSKDLSLNFQEGLPNLELNCERAYGIVINRGTESEVLEKVDSGVAYIGAGYVRTCDSKAIELKKSGFTVIVEKGCESDCFDFNYTTYKLLKTALNPNGVLV